MELTETTLLLIEALRLFEATEEEVLGIFTFLKEEEQQAELFHWMAKNPNATMSETIYQVSVILKSAKEKSSC